MQQNLTHFTTILKSYIMSKYIDSEKLIAEIERFSATEFGDNTLGDDVAKGALDYVLEEIIPSLQQEQQETNMKSPFTGGKVTILSREEEVTFRGEKIKITRKYYRCEDTGREFTDSKLDEDMMWDTFRAYCEKKGMTSFTDIMLKQEQQEVELEKELDSFITEHEDWDDDNKLANDIARHFAEWGAIHLNARKKQPKVNAKMRTCDKLEMEKLYGEE